MSGSVTIPNVGIYAEHVKAHIPNGAADYADMPRPPKLPNTTTERGLSPTDSVVIDNIDRLRKQHGEIGDNRSELARRATLDPSYIGKLLRKETSVSITSLHGIAGALGLEPWQLMVKGDWDLSNPPVLAPLTDSEKRLYAALREAMKAAP
jgi:transcriptional regulator with XRE-family HTH domain